MNFFDSDIFILMFVIPFVLTTCMNTEKYNNKLKELADKIEALEIRIEKMDTAIKVNTEQNF